uniref:Glycine rich superfamily member n=1 Tax=Rhipicephalus appendiculatus TaxID=34631 RepID=A0A131YFL1_RHIAP
MKLALVTTTLVLVVIIATEVELANVRGIKAPMAQRWRKAPTNKVRHRPGPKRFLRKPAAATKSKGHTHKGHATRSKTQKTGQKVKNPMGKGSTKMDKVMTTMMVTQIGTALTNSAVSIAQTSLGLKGSGNNSTGLENVDAGMSGTGGMDGMGGMGGMGGMPGMGGMI